MDLKNYKYLATNADGKKVRGTIEALNRNVVVKYLQTKNYTIENIIESNSLLSRLDSITFGRLLKPKQLIFLFKAIRFTT